MPVTQAHTGAAGQQVYVVQEPACAPERESFFDRAASWWVQRPIWQCVLFGVAGWLFLGGLGQLVMIPLVAACILPPVYRLTGMDFDDVGPRLRNAWRGFLRGFREDPDAGVCAPSPVDGVPPLPAPTAPDPCSGHDHGHGHVPQPAPGLAATRPVPQVSSASPVAMPATVMPAAPAVRAVPERTL